MAATEEGILLTGVPAMDTVDLLTKVREGKATPPRERTIGTQGRAKDTTTLARATIKDISASIATTTRASTAEPQTTVTTMPKANT